MSTPYISHYALRAKKYPEVVAWYKEVFNARVQHENDFLAFMTFDEEHHRFVIFDAPDTVDKVPGAAGVEHVAFGVATHGDLVDTYERLKAAGIKPAATVNHRFTTSIYYHDPDGNEVEFSVDNFPTKSETSAFMFTEDMNAIGRPPFGHEFDPEELVSLYRGGAPFERLARVGVADEL
jgi:catechol-2,3-dioxygenase